MSFDELREGEMWTSWVRREDTEGEVEVREKETSNGADKTPPGNSEPNRSTCIFLISTSYYTKNSLIHLLQLIVPSPLVALALSLWFLDILAKAKNEILIPNYSF